MNIKNVLLTLAIGAILSVAAGCGKGKDGAVEKAVAPTPGQAAAEAAAEAAAKPAADAALVQRVLQRVNYLITEKNYAEAKATLSQLDTLEIPPAFKTQVDAAKAKLPAN